MLDFSKQVVLVTGACGGIGSQIAHDFARAGASLVLHDYGLAYADKVLQQELQTTGAQPLLVEGDLTAPATTTAIAAQIQAQFGHLEVLVNNAGASPKKMAFEDLPLDTWDRVIDINLRSVFMVTQACLPLLKQSARSRIINISSIAARNGGALGGSAYAAAKGVVSSLSKAFAKDFSPMVFTSMPSRLAWSTRPFMATSKWPTNTPSASKAFRPAGLASRKTLPARCCFWPRRWPTTSSAKCWKPAAVWR